MSLLALPQGCTYLPGGGGELTHFPHKLRQKNFLRPGRGQGVHPLATPMQGINTANSRVMFTFLGDDTVADEILFVGDQDDDVVAFGRSQILQTRLRKDEGRSVGHRVNDQVCVYLFSVVTCPVSRLQRPHTAFRPYRTSNVAMCQVLGTRA